MPSPRTDESLWPRTLLVLPPLTQLNTPYPSTAFLTGYLRSRGVPVQQVDLGLELVLAIFSRDGLARVFDAIEESDFDLPEPGLVMLGLRRRYEATVDAVVRFLQGRDSTLAHRIVATPWLPQGPRFADVDDLAGAFGETGITDHARFLATRYLEDLADLIRATVAPHFGFSRYAESLAAAAPSYDPMAAALDEAPGVIDALLLERFAAAVERARPDVVGFSVPFPGNLYGALRCGRWLAEHAPDVSRLLGGGYVNTELRELAEPRLFDAVDYVTVDDGEQPIVALLEHLSGRRAADRLKRTFVRRDGAVAWVDGAPDADVEHDAIGTPDYDGLRLERYLSILETANPMHRLWSDGRWNKLMVAHGCYWRRCTFCDIGLDYIGRYSTAPASVLADRIEAIIEQTGETGFHFVDEAAPPASLRDLAIELIARDTVISWWGNIRFERSFGSDLCRLLSASGCIAVTGGLEVASDRLLERIDKGVTVAQVARVARNFTESDIMVHAYLMYGFPTQTAQETVDSLEYVRQMFALGIVHSGFWHRFTMTVHSPVGVDPDAFGVERVPLPSDAFARNDLAHRDPTGVDPEFFSEGLRTALYHYMHGAGFEHAAHTWFDGAPEATVAPDEILAALQRAERSDTDRRRARVVWLGEDPDWLVDPATGDVAGLAIWHDVEPLQLQLAAPVAEWLGEWLPRCHPRRREAIRLGTLLDAWPGPPDEAEAFCDTMAWAQLRENGLLLV